MIEKIRFGVYMSAPDVSLLWTHYYID